MPQSPNSKSMPPFSPPPVQNQQNGKPKYVRLPPWSFRNNLKNTSSHFSIDSLGLFLIPEYLLYFLSNLYVPQWLVFRLPGNAFESQKTESRHFKSAQIRFLPSPPKLKKIAHPLRQRFLKTLFTRQKRCGQGNYVISILFSTIFNLFTLAAINLFFLM